MPPEPIPLCYSYELSDTEESPTSPPSGAAGAYVISRSKLWKGKKNLKVYFMDDVPNHWKCHNDPLTIRVILDWAKVWYNNLPADIDGRQHIPKFVRTGSIREADIRVQLGSGRICKSQCMRVYILIRMFSSLLLLSSWGECERAPP